MPRTTARFRAFREACKYLGSQQGLAEALGIKPPSVSGWLQREPGRPEDVIVPLDRCAAIEILTDGRVRVEQLRPDTAWLRNQHGVVTGYVQTAKPAARTGKAMATRLTA